MGGLPGVPTIGDAQPSQVGQGAAQRTNNEASQRGTGSEVEQWFAQRSDLPPHAWLCQVDGMPAGRGVCCGGGRDGGLGRREGGGVRCKER